MFIRRSFLQSLSSIVILTLLFSGSSLPSVSAVGSALKVWLWRQPPYDPAHPNFPRPEVDVVAWGGVDKKVIYAGTTASTRPDMPDGLYRSKDQGNTWEYLGKVDENEYITQLIVHPTKPNIMLAGFNRTFYRGGIYRSADSGETWTSVLPYFSTYDIEIDPSHPNIIYATGYGSGAPPTINSGIYKSTDEGQTWQYISTLPWIPDVAVHPTSSNILFAVNDWGGVYRSNDAGTTWEQISQILANHRILIDPNNPDQMFVFGDAGVWRTEDGGRNWSDTTSNLPDVLSYTMIQTAILDPGDPNTIWVGLKYDGMYVSHDSGDHWEHASYGIYFLGAGIYGPQCLSSDIANGQLIVACSGRFYIQVPIESVAVVRVDIGGTPGEYYYSGYYFVPPGTSTRESLLGLNSGPVRIEGDRNIVAAERVIYKVLYDNTSFTEMMGLPNSQLDTTYWLPWYNNVDLETWLRIANVTNQPAMVNVTIGGQTMPGSPFSLAPTESTEKSFVGVNGGPVKIESDVSIVASERVIYVVKGLHTSFSEMMALPDSQLDNTYWMPWYNNVDLDTQLRFGNVSNTPAEVHVWIGGQEKTSGCTTTPSNIPYPYVLGAGASLRVSCSGVNNGPVKIISNVNIVAAERVIYNVNGLPTSFTEMMGLPDSHLDNTYWMPWYNNVDLDTQLRFGNVSNTPATVQVFIGGQEMTTGCNPSNIPYPYVLAAGASLRVSCPGVNNGPVQIISDVNIVAAERVIYNVNGMPTSFSEMMGLPNSQLDSTYWMPWHSNIGYIDTQLRFGVP